MTKTIQIDHKEGVWFVICDGCELRFWTLESAMAFVTAQALPVLTNRAIVEKYSTVSA